MVGLMKAPPHGAGWLGPVLGALAALACALFSAAPVAAEGLPRIIPLAPLGQDSSFPAAFAKSLSEPTRDPIGANNWSCKPSSKHPYPVVLVHGTFENAYDNWNGLSPILQSFGYCVYALNYGNTTGIAWLNGTGDLAASAAEIGPFVDRVLASTGAGKVDLIGHSQGGSIARYYTNLLGGAAKVRQVIGLAPSNHATSLDGIVALANTLDITGLVDEAFDVLQLPALVEQSDPGSSFYQQVNGNGETVPGMSYTVIATKVDEVVTPYTQTFITAGPGATVDNITIQNVCLIDGSDHVSLPYSKNVAQIILNKLDPGDQRYVLCYPQAFLTGGTGL